jgi:uncharacterized protein (TIGR03382 family)
MEKQLASVALLAAVVLLLLWVLGRRRRGR